MYLQCNEANKTAGFFTVRTQQENTFATLALYQQVNQDKWSKAEFERIR